MTKSQLISCITACGLFTLIFSQAAIANNVNAQVCGAILKNIQSAENNNKTLYNVLSSEHNTILQCNSQCGDWDFNQQNVGNLSKIAKSQGTLAAAATCRSDFQQLAYFSNYAVGLSKSDHITNDFNSIRGISFSESDASSLSQQSNSQSAIPSFVPSKAASPQRKSNIDYW